MSRFETVHWEHESKILCGASLECYDDRFLLDPRWVKRVNCPACVAAAERLSPPVAPPPANPEPMPEGWVMTYPGYAERKHRGVSVDSDADGITTEESVTGYGGYTATVYVPMVVLRALLATQGLHIVTSDEHAKLGILNDPALCWAALEAEMSARGYRFVDEAGARHARIGAALPDELLGLWFQYAPEHVDTNVHEDLNTERRARADEEKRNA